MHSRSVGTARLLWSAVEILVVCKPYTSSVKPVSNPLPELLVVNRHIAYSKFSPGISYVFSSNPIFQVTSESLLPYSLWLPVIAYNFTLVSFPFPYSCFLSMFPETLLQLGHLNEISWRSSSPTYEKMSRPWFFCEKTIVLFCMKLWCLSLVSGPIPQVGSNFRLGLLTTEMEGVAEMLLKARCINTHSYR